MIAFDQQALKQRLLAEGYSDFSARMMAEALNRIDERLNEALNKWIENGTITDFAASGITLTQVMTKAHTDFCNALFYMTLFLQRPEKAKGFFDVPFLYR